MVIDIASLDLKDRPVLALENLDETPIAILGNAFNIEAHIAYNDMSQITFDLPAYANGQPTQGYDDVIGTRLIRIPGWGVFILVNPETVGDGIKEIKSCKAYSREYEMTYKKMTLEENTYNLWNPVTPDSTILGIIVNEYLPYWHVGTVDSDLVGKYRTFSESNVNLYNFLKSTVQQKYGCIVDFDTVNRRINVRSTQNHATTEPVFISLDNLAKEIERAEDTENIFTCLDVNGADGVTIRGVNPTGTNKIYNLDYYMNTSHFSQEFIDKWNTWKQAFADRQAEYQILTIERMLKTSEIVSAQANITEVYGADLGALEAQQSVYIEALARLSPDSPSYAQAQANLDAVNAQIAAKESQIAAERTSLASLEAEKGVLTAELTAINRALDFSSYFTASELLLLKQYFKEDSIQDSSFVYAEAKNYTGTDETRALTSSSTVQITGSDSTTETTALGRKVVSCVGGSITVGTLTAALIRGTAEYDPTSHHCVLTAYLSFGTLGSDSFPNGCLTAVTDEGSFSDGSVINLGGGSGRMYFTRNTTEYEKYAVEWELYEYGKQCLEKLAYPSYSFSVDTANFLTVDAFAYFKSRIALGQKIYLDMGDGNVLEPIFIGFDIEMEDPSSLKLEFGDKYCLSDSAFELADLLNQSVSMGKTVDTSRFGYNAFIDSGASTAVKDYMDAALDVSKQAILSSGNIAISWDESGMKFRKWNQAHTEYEDEQIAIINNNIVFTDDGWQTAKMAIGHFQDDNAGDSWGIVAPNIVGTLLAGENLVIESTTESGGQAVFKVDGDGAVLHNAKFDIVRSNTVAPGVTQTSTHILLDPDNGFGIGTYPVINPQTGTWNESNAKFWVDMNGNVRLNNGYIDLRRNNTSSGQTQIIIDPELGFGIGTNSIVTTSGGNRQWDTSNTKLWVDTDGNLHIKGRLEAATGYFSGELQAATGYFNGVVRATGYEVLENGTYVSMMNNYGQFNPEYLNLKGIEIKNGNTTTFKVDNDGNVSVNGNITMGAGTTINWNTVNQSNGTATLNGDFDNPSTAAGSVASDASSALSAAGNAVRTANGAAANAGTALENIQALASGNYTEAGTTFISGKHIYSPTISGGIVSAGLFNGLDVGDKATIGQDGTITNGIRVSNSIEFVDTTGTTYTTKGWVGCVAGNDGGASTKGVGLSSYNIGDRSDSNYHYGGKIMLTNAGSLFDYSESETLGQSSGASLLAHVASADNTSWGEIKMTVYYDDGLGHYTSSDLVFRRTSQGGQLLLDGVNIGGGGGGGTAVFG